MKKIYILILCTVFLSASPLLHEEEALKVFQTIKQQEYNTIVKLWEEEMKQRRHSRTSQRKDIWDDGENPINEKDHSRYYPKGVK